MFGTVAAAGIRILSAIDLDRRASTIIAVSFGLGFGVTFVPEIMNGMPPIIKDTFSSGIATGGICALILKRRHAGASSLDDHITRQEQSHARDHECRA